MKLYLTSVACNVIDKIDFEDKKRVAFIPTAADPYERRTFVDIDREALLKKGLKVIDVDIKDKTEKQLSEELKNFEIIFVSGGNTFYLLEKMKECNFEKSIKPLLKEGRIYIGSSAGSVVACPDIEYIKSMDHPEEAKNLKDYKGLSLVNFYVLPHYGKEKYAEMFEEILEKNKHLKIIPLKDDELIIVDENGYRKE